MKQINAILLCSSALAVLALAGGCNFAPHYTPPLVQTPPAFKETNGWKLAQPSDGVLKGKWWEMFNDPQLNALEDQVAVSNQNVVAAMENFFAARALVTEARSALYPTVSVDPSVIKSHTPKSSGGQFSSVSNSVGTGSGTTTLYSLPVDASWELDLWGSIRNTARNAAFTAQADAAIIENMKLTAQAELAVDYYELRSQDEMIGLFNDTVKAYRTSLDLNNTLYKTGIVSPLNVAQADALLETTIAQATALAIQRAQYEHAIAVLIGQPPSTFSIKSASPPALLPVVPIGLPSDLLERRPDVASAERLAAAANAEIGVTRAAFFPTVSLSGSAGFQNSSVNNLLSSPNFFWSGAAAMSEVLLDFGKRKAANQGAWASYRSTVANYRQTVLTAMQQVEDNLAALRVLTDEMGQQDVAIQASQKNLDLSMEQYRLGVASYLNVVTAQESLLGNQQTAVSLRMQQRVDTVQLIMALGGGWTNSALPSPRRLELKTASGQ